MPKKSGLSIHCHHDVLVEYCHDYDERATYINARKPEHERDTRLRLFNLLPQAAIDELPKAIVKANAVYAKAHAAYVKSGEDFYSDGAAYDMAYKDYEKAYKDFFIAHAAWPEAEREAWHKKWCGCKEWNGKEIVFEKPTK